MHNFKIKSFTTLVLVIIFSTSIIVLTLLSIYNSNHAIHNTTTFLHTKAKTQLQHQKALILDNLELFKKYTTIVQKEIDTGKSYDEKEISRIINFHFLKEMGMFKIRLLNNKGIELIRYDLKQSKVIKSSVLQDKSNRYYYKEAKKISLDDIYFSKFDLNVENKKGSF